MYFVSRKTKKKENGVSIVNVCERQMQRGVGGRERETEGRRERETVWFCSCRSMVITCYHFWMF